MNMQYVNVRYRWCWKRLTLWRDFDYSECNGGGSDRVFTLWPKFIWWRIRDWTQEL